MRIYFKYAGMHVRSMLQYRLDFALGAIGQLVNTILMYLTIALLFVRFDSLAGYSFGEVALCYAVINLGFAVAECFARGFDTFGRLIRTGDFDRLLLRPRALALQVLGSDFDIKRTGRILFSLIVLAVAVGSIDTVWTAARAATVLFMCIGAAFIMGGVFILGSSLCFFTIQGLEIVNIFTDGGRQLASYPLTIFGKWVRRFFTFIIPFGAINYLPLLYVAGRTDHPLYMLLPLLGPLFTLLALAIWYACSTRYLSTGS